MKAAYLILENGIVFKGQAFGAEIETIGEIVFTTAMTGYLETLTDPSHYGQIVLQTFPLIGNYGVIPEDFESKKIALFGYIVKYPCELPSNFRSMESLDILLKKHNVAGLCGIDTRMLTKIIRSCGVMNGKITFTPPAEQDRMDAQHYMLTNAIMQVSAAGFTEKGNGKRKIALMDFGAKGGIEDALLRRNCTVVRFNYAAKAEEIIKIKPSGIVLSNGPGNPADPANRGIIETVSALDKSGLPIMGICLGHQLLALAKGYTTYKMKFGHRGANQAVKDTTTGRVYITSQNHGYAVKPDMDSAKCNGSAKCSFVNVNDGTNEGLDYGLSFSVQFHPEAQGGPLDTSFLFDHFMERIDKHAGR